MVKINLENEKKMTLNKNVRNMFKAMNMMMMA